jgi:hypothetical protein
MRFLLVFLFCFFGKLFAPSENSKNIFYNNIVTLILIRIYFLERIPNTQL